MNDINQDDEMSQKNLNLIGTLETAKEIIKAAKILVHECDNERIFLGLKDLHPSVETLRLALNRLPR